MTRDWSGVRLVAHRCGGALAPENSLAGLAAAAAAGYVAVEFDVMLSADGVPVVIHDETLERTTDGHGAVAARTAAELQQLHCGKGRPGFENEFIPTLSAVLARCHALRLLPNVEIKPSLGADEVTGTVVARQVEREWAALGGVAAQLVLSSFSAPALQAAAAAAPGLPRACLFESVPADWPARLAAVGAVAMHCAATGFDRATLAGVQAARIPLRCYTVNDPAQAAALFGEGIAAVFTDALDDLAGLG